ncbi:TetR/AcrR family transcriptional repressor of nem operon [Pseudomonas sp. JUb42]|nr:TetR/AcrR family transcriptional repressor of nem operon [Pseudomonas sp. JUb42]
MRDIEDATGLTAGSIYKAYGSKRELFLLCLEQYLKEESYLALLLAMFESPLDESLRMIFDTIIDTAYEGSERPAGCLITKLFAELLSVDACLGRGAISGLNEMQKTLRLRLMWAQENGDLDKRADVDALGAYLMVVIQGMLVVSTSTKDILAMKMARDMALSSLH